MPQSTKPDSYPKKKEPEKPVVDEKKEKMKSALFSGISAKKDDSSDDEKQKEKEKEKEPEPT